VALTVMLAAFDIAGQHSSAIVTSERSNIFSGSRIERSPSLAMNP